MFNCNLSFTIRLPYESKLYNPLKELGDCIYSKVTKKYHWTFPLENIRKVVALLGKTINIKDEDFELVRTFTKNYSQLINEPNKQGRGFIKVTLSQDKPNHFLVTTVRERKPVNVYVSYDKAFILWSTIKKQPLDKKILTCTIAKNYCEALGIEGFHVYTNGRFNWKYFSGSRKHYLIFYATIKVLAHFGLIEHIISGSQSGVKRIADTWEMQTILNYEEETF